MTPMGTNHMEAMTVELMTIKEAAAELNTTVATIRGLVRAHGIVPKPVPRNGNAKGLDESDMATLRRSLGRDVSPPAD
jgi:hypothetical protein